MSPFFRTLLLPSLLAVGGLQAQPCLVDYTFVASTPPTNGTYACGETVTFCFTVTNWSSTNANWFHGITATFGPGWDVGSIVPGAAPASCAGSGTWAWYPSVQGTAGTALGPQGPGFFYDFDPPDGNPGNNFGDFCTGVVAWEFCWTISVLNGPACVNGLGLGVSVNTFGDSETGGWGSAGCGSDPVGVSPPAVIQSCNVSAGLGGPLVVCSTSPPQSLINTLTGSPDAGGVWTGPTGSLHSGLLDPSIDGSGNYTYTVTSLAPPCSAQAVIAVTVQQQPSAGGSGSLTTCASDASTNLFTLLTGTPDVGGTWTAPSGGAFTGPFDPAVDVPGMYTYSIPASAPCTAVSSTIDVSVNPSANAGVSGSITLCSTSASAALFPVLGGSPSVGGEWTDPDGAPFIGTYDPTTDSPGIFTYSVAGIAPCANSSATITVVENQQPDAGGGAPLIDFCEAASPIALISLLEGSPDAGGTWTGPGGTPTTANLDPSVAANGTYTYTVVGTAPCTNAQSTLEIGVIQQPDAGSDAVVDLCNASAPVDLFDALGVNADQGGNWTSGGIPVGPVFTPGTDTPGDLIYTLVATLPCVDVSSTVTVNVTPQPSAGSDATLSLCSSSASSPLFPLLGPNAQVGGTWTTSNGTAVSSVFEPGTSTDGDYTYTVTAPTPCTSASAVVTVTTTTALDPGTDGTLSLCSSDAQAVLFSSLGGSPQAGGVWTTPNGGLSDGTIDPAIAATGTYQYTLPADGPCPATNANVVVSIAQAVSAGLDGAYTLCSSVQAPYALVEALSGTPGNNGTWTGPDGQPHGPTFNTATDDAGIYTYTVTAVAPCTAASSAVTMSVVQAATAGQGGSATLCAFGPSIDPTTWLTGSPSSNGTWTGPSGAILTSIDPTTASSGNYTYTVPGTAPCPNVQSTVVLTVQQLPNAGSDAQITLCVDAAPTTLTPLLGNGAGTGGSWSGPAGPSSGSFDPTLHLPGGYTYTVAGTGICAGMLDEAVITVNTAPLPEPKFVADVVRGCAPLEVIFTNTSATGIASAQWQFGDGSIASANTTAPHTYTVSGEYSITLQVIDTVGCAGSITLEDVILVSAGPDADFSVSPLRVSVEDPTVQVGHSPDVNVLYMWTIAGDDVDTPVPSWTFAPAVVGSYSICLVATDTLGCTNSVCTDVVVDDELTIYTANAFSPNGDGLNDTFNPSVIGVEPVGYEFRVFDRWGMVVFSTTDPYASWNGGMGNAGDPMQQDVYVWRMWAKDQFTTERRVVLGTVTLVK